MDGQQRHQADGLYHQCELLVRQLVTARCLRIAFQGTGALCYRIHRVMTVYLGTFGEVGAETSIWWLRNQLDIDTGRRKHNKKRFSFDFDHGQLLTGDQIEITSTDDSALDFIDSYTDSSVKKFIYVDELDGIRLYDSFANAVGGGIDKRNVACGSWKPIPHTRSR